MVDRGCAKATTLKEVCESSGLSRQVWNFCEISHQRMVSQNPDWAKSLYEAGQQVSRSSMPKITLTEAVHSCRHFAIKMARQEK